MPDYLFQREKPAERIDSLCDYLFKLWCEEKKQVPLAYLLHCWPLVDRSPRGFRRLAESMSDLAQFQTEWLSTHAAVLLRVLIAHAHELAAQPLPARAAPERSAALLQRAFE